VSYDVVLARRLIVAEEALSLALVVGDAFHEEFTQETLVVLAEGLS